MEDKFPYFYDKKLDEETNKKVNLEIMKFAGMYILKRLDPEAPDDVQYKFNVPLENQDELLEPVLDDLLFRDLIEIDGKEACYKITEKGLDYTEQLVEEIERYIDKYGEIEPGTRVQIMRTDGINLLRTRFLWGWYDGEFDDVVEFQNNIEWEGDIQQVWQIFITQKQFYDVLFEDINVLYDIDDDELERVRKEAMTIRQEQQSQLQQQEVYDGNDDDDMDEETSYYYHDPYYYNPVRDPLFWFIVFW